LRFSVNFVGACGVVPVGRGCAMWNAGTNQSHPMKT
jgi:hypothetical protein